MGILTGREDDDDDDNTLNISPKQSVEVRVGTIKGKCLTLQSEESVIGQLKATDGADEIYAPFYLYMYNLNF